MAIGKDDSIIRDDRGAVIPVADDSFGFRAVMIIDSIKGAIRANHLHQRDAHWMFIVSGKARYVEIINDGYEEHILEEGDRIFTSPGVPHAMEFLEDTRMIVCTKQPRDYDTYMADIIKVKVL